MIRPAALTDAAAIARIHVETWRAAYAGTVPQVHLDALDPVARTARWEGILSSGSGLVLVEVEAGRVIGWINAGPSRDPDANHDSEIYALYVEPALWRGGHGARLLQAAEDACPASPALTLWVLAANQRARAFYARQGFREDGAAKDITIAGASLRELRYRKILPRD